MYYIDQNPYLKNQPVQLSRNNMRGPAFSNIYSHHESNLHRVTYTTRQNCNQVQHSRTTPVTNLTFNLQNLQGPDFSNIYSQHESNLHRVTYTTSQICNKVQHSHTTRVRHLTFNLKNLKGPGLNNIKLDINNLDHKNDKQRLIDNVRELVKKYATTNYTLEQTNPYSHRIQFITESGRRTQDCPYVMPYAKNTIPYFDGYLTSIQKKNIGDDIGYDITITKAKKDVGEEECIVIHYNQVKDSMFVRIDRFTDKYFRRRLRYWIKAHIEHEGFIVDSNNNVLEFKPIRRTPRQAYLYESYHNLFGKLVTNGTGSKVRELEKKLLKSIDKRSSIFKRNKYKKRKKAYLCNPKEDKTQKEEREIRNKELNWLEKKIEEYRRKIKTNYCKNNSYKYRTSLNKFNLNFGCNDLHPEVWSDKIMYGNSDIVGFSNQEKARLIYYLIATKKVNSKSNKKLIDCYDRLLAKIPYTDKFKAVLELSERKIKGKKRNEMLTKAKQYDDKILAHYNKFITVKKPVMFGP